jgi:hypothetical protein
VWSVELHRSATGATHSLCAACAASCAQGGAQLNSHTRHPTALFARRGHGTLLVDGRLVASLCGVVQRINKLIYVQPVKSRRVSSVVCVRACAPACVRAVQSVHDAAQRSRRGCLAPSTTYRDVCAQ